MTDNAKANDADGDDNDTFLLTELKPGKYRVGVEADGYGRTYSEPVTVEAGQTIENIVISLGAGAVVAGRVVLAATGEPVKGAELRLRAASGEETGLSFLEDVHIEGMIDSMPDFPGRGFSKKATSDAEGQFRLADIPAGDYMLKIKSDDCAPIDDQQLSLALGEQRENLKYELFLGGEVTGRVLDLASNPVVGETIWTQGPLPGSHKAQGKMLLPK